MGAQETARKGIAVAISELERRGASVRPGRNAQTQNWLRVMVKDRSPVDAYVKSRAVGAWQTDTRKGTPRSEQSDDGGVWIFVDLSTESPTFYVAPSWWVENDINETYQADLARFGGRRPRSPASTHHGIPEKRIARWRDRWDLLGLEQ
jgi:hypothetical protein